MSPFKDLLAAVSSADGSLVGAIGEYFRRLGRVTVLDGAATELLNHAHWPKGPGAYLIWHRPGPVEARRLLYVGKTGKLTIAKERGWEMNRGGLSKRLGRWTPYVFQRRGPHTGFFQWGPNFKGSKRPPDNMVDAYRNRYPLREIVVECITLSDIEQWISPALLEAVLLQAFVAEQNALPPANQEL